MFGKKIIERSGKIKAQAGEAWLQSTWRGWPRAAAGSASIWTVIPEIGGGRTERRSR
jgi:hypothetical protein